MKQEERWKIIDGFSDYEISNFGSIRRSVTRIITKSNGVLYTAMAKRIHPALDSCGYYRTMITGDDGIPHTVKIHRLVAAAFIPNPYSKPHINHINLLRDDNRVENLEWVTPQENVDHSMRFGMFYKCLKQGSSNGNSKLKEEDVVQIRRKYIPVKYSLNKLAKEYGVSKKLILLITQNKVWNHV